MQKYIKAIEEILKRGYTLEITPEQEGYFKVHAEDENSTCYVVVKDWRKGIKDILKSILKREEFIKIVKKSIKQRR